MAKTIAIDCVGILYNEVSKQVPITRSEYEKTLVGWDVSPINIGGEDIGVMMRQGTEIHICIPKEKALKHARQIIKKCLVENIQKYGYLTTISLKDSGVTRFLERLGFCKTNEDEAFISYRLDTIKIK